MYVMPKEQMFGRRGNIMTNINLENWKQMFLSGKLDDPIKALLNQLFRKPYKNKKIDKS